MRLLIILFLSAISLCANAQQTLPIRITAGLQHNPVHASIIVKGINQVFTSDSSGIANINFVSNDRYTLLITAAGYETKEEKIIIPYITDTLTITLEINEHEMEEVIVQSTRTSRTIANVPTRVETIEMEEIDEKNNMRPANVAMLLHESTGIQVQQTSATSANASIRIQGLDGRYTQLLKDGFPNFGNFSSGLSVLEIPPIDLKQVEIIKGPASPLFGGGAIAGVINFISKTPKEKPEYSFLLNQSNIGQSNAGAFLSGKGKKAGYTLLALYNHQKAYDVDKDDFTELPKSNEFTIHPKLFIYPSAKTTIIVANSFTQGERIGGDLKVIDNNADANHQYFEKNKTTRNISSLQLDMKAGNKNITLKQSFAFFDRTISLPGYIFRGRDNNSFTDISLVSNGPQHALVLGSNFIFNNFTEKNNGNANRDNTSRTGGIYAQHTWDASEKIKLETGLRLDIANYKNKLYSNTEAFVLPRISLLIKYNSAWASRISGGIGYKTPTLFTEETERIQYKNVEQLNNVKSEKSYGGTADVNFRTSINDDLAFSFNHMFFYTLIQKPLILVGGTGGLYNFINAAKPVTSKGFETNVKFVYKENFKLFLGYTFTDANAKYRTGKSFLPLVPQHKLNSALIYEKEGVIKLGLEGYFTGRQYLDDGSRTPSFKVLGFMAEKIFNKFAVFINFENFTDTRQGRYKNVVGGTHTSPVFDEIWTHTEGFVMNGGIKIKL